MILKDFLDIDKINSLKDNDIIKAKINRTSISTNGNPITFNQYNNMQSNISIKKQKIGHKTSNINILKTKENCYNNGNKRLKIHKSNFDEFTCLSITITLQQKHSNKNILNYNVDNHLDFDHLTKKDSDLIYKIFTECALIFDSRVDFFMTNIDFHKDGIVHYHCNSRMNNLNLFNGNLVNKLFIKILNYKLNKIGMSAKVQKIYDVNGWGIYLNKKLFDINKIEDEDLNTVFHNIPNYTKMEYLYGEKLNSVDFIGTVKELKETINILFNKSIYIANSYLKCTYLTDYNNKLIGKIIRGVFQFNYKNRLLIIDEFNKHMICLS